jgi:hypothetical protein
MGNTISPAEVQYQILEGLLLQKDTTKEDKDKTIELFQEYKKYFEKLFKDQDHEKYKKEYLEFIEILINLVKNPQEESIVMDVDVDAAQQTDETHDVHNSEIGNKEKDSSRRVTFDDNLNNVPS